MCENAIPLKAIQGSANSEYKLAILSAHRKTSASVINSFILNYPVLPFCDCEPLSEPSMIIRYGQEISLKITVKQAIADAKGEEQISKFRELVIPSTRGAFEKKIWYKTL